MEPLDQVWKWELKEEIKKCEENRVISSGGIKNFGAIDGYVDNYKIDGVWRYKEDNLTWLKKLVHVVGLNSCKTYRSSTQKAMI